MLEINERMSLFTHTKRHGKNIKPLIEEIRKCVIHYLSSDNIIISYNKYDNKSIDILLTTKPQPSYTRHETDNGARKSYSKIVNEEKEQFNVHTREKILSCPNGSCAFRAFAK